MLRNETMADLAWTPSESSSPLSVTYIIALTRLGALDTRADLPPAGPSAIMRRLLGEPMGTCRDLVYSMHFAAISVVVSWLLFMPLGPHPAML